MAIGKNLKKIIEDRNIKVSELSKISGIQSQTLYAIINRDNDTVKPDILRKIALAMNISVDELLGNIPFPDKNYNFNFSTILDLTYDIYEEIYNHSKLKYDIGLTARTFMNKDKYFIEGLANNFLSMVSTSQKTLNKRINQKDNAPLRDTIITSYRSMTKDTDLNGAVVTKAHCFELGNKLNDEKYLESKIKEYNYYLNNVKNSIDNYELIESGLKDARDVYKNSCDGGSNQEDGAIQATQQDMDNF